MARYVALLRGVNVGGVNLKMADVRAAFTAIGFGNVSTVLASGNVMFDTEDGPAATKPRIERALADTFGYPARVHVLSLAEIERVITDFPFDADREGWHPYVIFLMGDEPRDVLLSVDLDADLEAVSPGDGVIYWTVERGRTLTSAIGKATARARIKELTTTRNLRTLKKLVG